MNKEFEIIKNEVYKNFDYDLNGCDTEILVLRYICQKAVVDAFNSIEPILESHANLIDVNTEALTKAMKRTTEGLAAQVKGIEQFLNKNLVDTYEAQKKNIKADAELIVLDVLKNSANELNTNLGKGIDDLVVKFEHARFNAEKTNNAMNSSLAKFSIFTLLGGALGGIIAFMLMILLQNSGVINIPMNIQLNNPEAIANIIINSLPK